MDKLSQDKSFIYLTIPILLIFVFSIIYLIYFNMNKKTEVTGDFNVSNPYDAPEIQGIDSWINTDGIKLEDLKGKVVLIDFWTYSCINCIRTIPYIEGWYEKYKDDGFIVIGVHSPEFAFERELSNVQEAVKDYGITYPVGLDNDFKTWRAYNNKYWPAHYFIDKNGKVRHTHFGEGEYTESEKVIQQLLLEGESGKDLGELDKNETEDPPINRRQSPETYLGYGRIDNFSDKESIKKDIPQEFNLNSELAQNEWTLGGLWQIREESAQSLNKGTKLRMKVSAKDVYLVMGSVLDGSKVKVSIVGKENYYGEDVDENGMINVGDFRLYKLVSFDKFEEGQILELEFDEGVTIHAFTFGG